jgi:hypothetical protein
MKRTPGEKIAYEQGRELGREQGRADAFLEALNMIRKIIMVKRVKPKKAGKSA